MPVQKKVQAKCKLWERGVVLQIIFFSCRSKAAVKSDRGKEEKRLAKGYKPEELLRLPQPLDFPVSPPHGHQKYGQGATSSWSVSGVTTWIRR